MRRRSEVGPCLVNTQVRRTVLASYYMYSPAAQFNQLVVVVVVVVVVLTSRMQLTLAPALHSAQIPLTTADRRHGRISWSVRSLSSNHTALARLHVHHRHISLMLLMHAAAAVVAAMSL